MSLDISLTLDYYVEIKRPLIYVRENGRTVGLTVDEWNSKNPDRLVEVKDNKLFVETDVVWEYNITHNLVRMAKEALLYNAIWNPWERGIDRAGDLIEYLRDGLDLLESNPDHFRQFNPSNGWGDYEGFVEFVREYLKACRTWPDAKIGAWG